MPHIYIKCSEHLDLIWSDSLNLNTIKFDLIFKKLKTSENNIVIQN